MSRCWQDPSALLHTYSIVARDGSTGQMGVAVQSHWFSVGSLVCWARAGIGAVATQSVVRVSYGPRGLDRMARGLAPSEALAELLAMDEGRELRQVAMVDAKGRSAAHTGKRCIAAAGHQVGEGYSVQANMMASGEVWPAMARAYEQACGDFAGRMLSVLDAAQAVGGDVRGKQSAAILLVEPRPGAEPWEEVVMDLRVEDHPEPLTELRRLVSLHRAYQHMNRGDELLGQGHVEDALQEYRTAAQLAPAVPELPFWQAVTLADLGRLEEARPIFQSVFARDPNLAVLLKRLPAAGLFRDDPELIASILDLAPRDSPHP